MNNYIYIFIKFWPWTKKSQIRSSWALPLFKSRGFSSYLSVCAEAHLFLQITSVTPSVLEKHYKVHKICVGFREADYWLLSPWLGG